MTQSSFTMAVLAWALLTLPTMAPPAMAQTVDPDGTVHADGVTVPLSEFLSPQARALLAARLTTPAAPMVQGDGFVSAARAASDRLAKGVIAQWQARYPARVDAVTMGGVQTDVVTPTSGIAPHNARRVLINLHGGGFFAGARTGGQAEAIPLAGRGRIKVVAVDYRLAPEHRFPAASQDVEQVYRALLKHYRPENIGIYGCSAGGTLVAESMAWFQHRHLPAPGAIGMFCSGAMPGYWSGGDSFAVTPMMNARPPVTKAQLKGGVDTQYLADTRDSDPLVTPGLFPAVLARFPPTLIVTGTRDTAMSNALATNGRLIDAGVKTELLVQEGMGHGDFTLLVGTPEAEQAYAVIWHFFDRHLGRR